MPPKQTRYQMERVAGSPDVERLQDRLKPVLERISKDREESASAASSAATASGTSYSPAVAADWTDDPPSTISDALDRIAAALGPIA